MLWFRASASMPVVSRPVQIHDQLLLDGGITDAVPYSFMEEQGYRRNVIVLTQPKGYRKEPASGMAMMKIMLRKYPCVSEAMAARHLMYNRQMDEIDQRETSGESLVIRPPQSLWIGHTEKNPDELERVYQIGVHEAEKRLEDIQSFLTGGDME
jgi:predicted patatin/cPLA2 family phospholipase